MKKLIILSLSHLLFAAVGFAAGIYALPILTAPAAPSASEVAATMESAILTGEFRRDLAGSDLLHWGEGTVSVGPRFISLQGRIAPGPDYKLYLAPEFVETEAEFESLKPRMVQVGDVKTFDNFIVPVPQDIDPTRFNTVIVWCESFGEFITAARYQGSAEPAQ
ncbi:MAG: DM13 domain-containing protein [Gammaproteobacteria bacterium]|jgi:hypothetical protein